MTHNKTIKIQKNNSTTYKTKTIRIKNKLKKYKIMSYNVLARDKTHYTKYNDLNNKHKTL